MCSRLGFPLFLFLGCRKTADTLLLNTHSITSFHVLVQTTLLLMLSLRCFPKHTSIAAHFNPPSFEWDCQQKVNLGIFQQIKNWCIYDCNLVHFSRKKNMVVFLRCSFSFPSTSSVRERQTSITPWLQNREENTLGGFTTDCAISFQVYRMWSTCLHYRWQTTKFCFTHRVFHGSQRLATLFCHSSILSNTRKYQGGN